jgi:hypothetical protein
MADKGGAGRARLTPEERRKIRLAQKAKHLSVVDGDGTKRPAAKAQESTPAKSAPEYVDTAVLLTELVKGISLVVQGLGSLNRAVKALDEKVDCLSEEVEFLSQVTLAPPRTE